MNSKTSWGKVAGWYGKLVGKTGHYYHQEVILPGSMRLLNLKDESNVLELGCGQGILARSINPRCQYLGLDIAPELIEEARKLDKNINHKYGVADATGRLPIRSGGFSHGVMILTLQNIKHPFKAVKNMAEYLGKNGRLLIVLNHPAFRIPKHSDWGVDRDRKVQYRKIDKYMSRLEIPIDSSPFDKNNNRQTWSYHYPLSTITEMITDNGFLIEKIEEWVSPKKSEGGMAKVEDAARAEFPMFMAIVAVKK